MLAMYVAKGVARPREERTLIARYVANDKAQSETVSTGNLLHLSLSGFSSTNWSNADCKASRRSPISTKAPSWMRFTRGVGKAKRSVLGSQEESHLVPAGCPETIKMNTINVVRVSNDVLRIQRHCVEIKELKLSEKPPVLINVENTHLAEFTNHV